MNNNMLVSKLSILFTIVFLVAGLIAAMPMFAYEDSVTCDKCAKWSELSWNPEDTYVSEQLSRFYFLEDKITAAYSASEFSPARILIKEYLELADIYRCNWNYGNAIHDANSILGLISLKEGNIDEAATYLIKAGKSPGSPQLDSFGPEMDLANELLKSGKTDEVKIYLKDVKTFWESGDRHIDNWLEQIDNGERPELNRFSEIAGFSQFLIFWLTSLWPVFTTAIFLIVLRNKIAKRILFGVTSIIAGYVSMFVLNWVVPTILINVSSKLTQSLNSTILMLAMYALIGAVYYIPILVVFGISRAFMARND